MAEGAEGFFDSGFEATYGPIDDISAEWTTPGTGFEGATTPSANTTREEPSPNLGAEAVPPSEGSGPIKRPGSAFAVQPRVEFVAEFDAAELARRGGSVAALREALPLSMPPVPAGATVIASSLPATTDSEVAFKVSIDLTGAAEPEDAMELLVGSLLFNPQALLDEAFVEAFGEPTLRSVAVSGGEPPALSVPPSPPPSVEDAMRVLVQFALVSPWGDNVPSAGELLAIQAALDEAVAVILARVAAPSAPPHVEARLTGAELSDAALHLDVGILFPRPGTAGAGAYSRRLAAELVEALWLPGVLRAELAAAGQSELSTLSAKPRVALVPASQPLASTIPAFRLTRPGADDTPLRDPDVPWTGLTAAVRFSLLLSDIDAVDEVELQREVSAAVAEMSGSTAATTALNVTMQPSGGAVALDGRATFGDPSATEEQGPAARLFLALAAAQASNSTQPLGVAFGVAYGPALVVNAGLDAEMAGRLGSSAAAAANPPPAGEMLERGVVEPEGQQPMEPITGTGYSTSNTGQTVAVALAAVAGAALLIGVAFFSVRSHRARSRSTPADITGPGNLYGAEEGRGGLGAFMPPEDIPPVSAESSGEVGQFQDPGLPIHAAALPRQNFRRDFYGPPGVLYNESDEDGARSATPFDNHFTAAQQQQYQPGLAPNVPHGGGVAAMAGMARPPAYTPPPYRRPSHGFKSPPLNRQAAAGTYSSTRAAGYMPQSSADNPMGAVSPPRSRHPSMGSTQYRSADTLALPQLHMGRTATRASDPLTFVPLRTKYGLGRSATEQNQ